MLRIVLVSIFMFCGPAMLKAQHVDSLSISSKYIQEEETEEVNGILAFAGYLGKKAYEEISDQFIDEKNAAPKQTRRVRIKLGPIKIERIEKR